MNSMSLVLFGASGDLAKRKIFPALYNLFLDQKMPDSFSIIGVGRRDWTDEYFQALVEDSIKTFSRRPVMDDSRKEEFLNAFRYCSLDVTNAEGFKDLLALVQQREKELNIPENRLFYLSVAPTFFDVIAKNIHESGLGSTKGWKRL
ncbi:glucose-6-phosphate dehydrogenase, partial [Bacillus smithii]